jgi:hypothetical protein
MSVIYCGKRVKYIYYVKIDLFGCFRIEEIRDNDNETSLKEEKVMKIENYSASSRDAHSFAFDILLTFW